jgi:hypothetical protein
MPLTEVKLLSLSVGTSEQPRPNSGSGRDVSFK